MPIPIERPQPTVCQISGNNPEGRSILSVLHRVTYLRQHDGQLERAQEQSPLVPEALSTDTRHLIADADTYPMKPLTDLVVLGHSYGRGRTQCDATVSVNGKPVKTIRVIGHRTCAALGSGDILFSPPEPFDQIPLTYRNAYGGFDRINAAKSKHPWLAFMKEMNLDSIDNEMLNLFCSPRNPLGKGYLIEATTEAINTLELPNLEDPLDLLTPKRIVVGHPAKWHRMPLPQATEWVHHTWFPRHGYLGVNPGVYPEDAPLPIVEVERGYVPSNILELRQASIEDAFLFTCGASLGLQLPHFRGGEVIRLENMHPKESRVEYRLPSDRPRIWVDGRKGTLKETEPVIHTVIIEPDLDRVSVVWRGCAPALRPYLPQELEKMPLKVEW